MSSLVWPLCVLAAGMLLAAAGHFTVRHHVPLPILRAHNEAIGNYLVILATLYGILLGFTILTLWGGQQDAEKNTVVEANELTSLFRIGRSLPGSRQGDLLSGIRAYARSVADKEWKSMARNTGAKENFSEIDRLSIEYPVLDEIWADLTAFKPATEAEKILLAQAVRRYEGLLAARRIRLLESERHLPPYLWVVMVVGGVFIVACTYFIGMENIRSQAILIAMTAGFIGLMLFVIWDMENPFRGFWAVSKKPYELSIMRMDSVMRAAGTASR